MREKFLAWPGCVLLAVIPTVADAQVNAIPASNGDGLDTHLFRPAMDSRGLFSVNGVDVLGAGSVGFGLVMDYGRNILRMPDAGATPSALVSDSFQGTFHFDYGVGDRAVFGVSTAVIGMSGPPEAAVAGWGPRALDAEEVANVALHGKVRLLRADSGVGLAVAAQVGIPVSDAPRNAGADPAPWVWPLVIVEKRFAHDVLRLAFNFGYRGHAASTTTLALREGTMKDGNLLTYGLGASLRVLPPVDLVAETYGTYLLGDSDAKVRPSTEAVAGAKIFVEESSYLTVGAGPRITSGFEAADVRAMVGFLFEPPIGDRDGDGVRDDVDACPTKAGARSSDPEKNGCPADSDDDGAPDAEDACPYVKGFVTRDAATNGCLPETPADRDRDGVPDVVDACPDIAGYKHADPARNGCPDIVFSEVEMTVFDKINFRISSAEILPQSNPILDKVANAIHEHPALTLIEVSGHADERGAEKMNLALTQARVDSVVAALVRRGVEPARLRAKGYGYYCPIDDRHDEAAWSKNRRVEFFIVKTVRGKTGVDLGCATAAAHGVTPDPVP